MGKHGRAFCRGVFQNTLRENGDTDRREKEGGKQMARGASADDRPDDEKAWGRDKQ